jgi:hypothetical protein
MKLTDLAPFPTLNESFRRNRERFVPERSGCYALSTWSGIVLYIGLSNNLRKRMNAHLDTPEKINTTTLGRAAVFSWLECEEINKVERTWMNIHIQYEGMLPILNSIYSPTST